MTLFEVAELALILANCAAIGWGSTILLRALQNRKVSGR